MEVPPDELDPENVMPFIKPRRVGPTSLLALVLWGCGGGSSATPARPPSRTGGDVADRCGVFRPDALEGLVRGTTEPDISIDEATPAELVAVVPGVEVRASVTDGKARLFGPVRGTFHGTLTDACEGPDAHPRALSIPAPADVAWRIPASVESQEARFDVDFDGIEDHVRSAVDEDTSALHLEVTLSRVSATSRLRVPATGDVAHNCFGRVDDRLALIQFLIRGSESGLRVYVLDATGAWRPQAHLLGRVVAGAFDDRPDVFEPPAPELWQADGYASRVDRCPLEGRGLDITRDTHYPIDDEPAWDEPALLRIAGLASTYERLPPGPGPLVEMRTTSRE